MALRNPFESLNPPPRPRWKSQLTSAQYGSMAEDLFGVSLAAAGAGSGSVARPLVDRGVDLYYRRLRSLLTLLIQVKAFRFLTADGIGNLVLPVSAMPAGRNGYLALVHLPAPYDQLFRRIFLIPFAELERRCPRVTSRGIESFAITASFSQVMANLWSDFAVDLDDLDQWLDAIPGWGQPISPVLIPEGLDVTQPAGQPEWESSLGRAWVATELQRAGGIDLLVIEDRVRLDTVTLLVHDLKTGRLAGLHVRTQRISASRTVHFEVVRPTFFIDDNMYVLLLLLKEDATPYEFSLLMPSQAIPRLGYSETITVDPLTKKFEPYRTPASEVAARFLRAGLGSA